MTKLEGNIFLRLYKFQNEVVIMRLVHSSGSVVDPASANYNLWNSTWNCVISPIKQGGEIYYILTNTESYLLRQQNAEVWKYGNQPQPPPTATFVSY